MSKRTSFFILNSENLNGVVLILQDGMPNFIEIKRKNTKENNLVKNFWKSLEMQAS